jgi:hypothetical protein
MTQHANTLPLVNSNTRPWRLFSLFAMAILALTLAGCGSPDKNHYDAGANARSITIDKGKDFSINLLVNIQVGGHWEIVELDRNIVDLKMKPLGRAQIVAGGLPRLYSYNFVFEGKNIGTTTLKMNLLKDGEDAPLDTLTSTIFVK